MQTNTSKNCLSSSICEKKVNQTVGNENFGLKFAAVNIPVYWSALDYGPMKLVVLILGTVLVPFQVMVQGPYRVKAQVP